jgi:eukaryotic-like serine/threonine-protein kinase
MVLSALVWAGAGATPVTERARHAVAAPPQFGLAAQSSAPCQVDYAVHVDTGHQFVAAATVTNTGTTELTDWSLRFTFPGGQRVAAAQPARWEQHGSDVRLSPAPDAAALAPGATAVLKLAGSYDGVNRLPLEFELNGLGCDVSVAAATGSPMTGASELLEVASVGAAAGLLADR